MRETAEEARGPESPRALSLTSYCCCSLSFLLLLMFAISRRLHCCCSSCCQPVMAFCFWLPSVCVTVRCYYPSVSGIHGSLPITLPHHHVLVVFGTLFFLLLPRCVFIVAPLIECILRANFENCIFIYENHTDKTNGQLMIGLNPCYR